MGKNSVGFGNIYSQSWWGDIAGSESFFGDIYFYKALSVDYKNRVELDGGVLESLSCTF